MKLRYLYFALSLLLLIPGLVSLVQNGLRLGIDFTGGSLIEVKVNDSVDSNEFTLENVKSAAEPLYEVYSVQSSGDHQYIIRGKEITFETKTEVMKTLSARFASSVYDVRFETVGPTLGKELISKTITAIVLAAILITLYIAHQFSELKYGVSAILAMFHDTLILLGAFSLLGKFMGVEVDVLFVTALLTTLSFSVHDTIVVYNQIKEFKKKHPRLPLTEVINAAVLQTLSRSLNNSITIIVMLVALVLLGGESIKWFAMALLIGAVTGTYSSTFTAAPLLLLWDEVGAKVQGARYKVQGTRR